MAIKGSISNSIKLVKVAWAARRVGSSGFQPFESILALVDSAGVVATEAINNLADAGYPPSSTKLSGSFKAAGPIRNGIKVQANVMAFDYYKYLNKGVHRKKGNRKGSKLTAGIKNISGSQAKQHSIGNAAKKKSKISTAGARHQNSRSLRQKRDGRGFFDKAVVVGSIYAEENLRRAFAQDIINSLEKF